MGLEDLLDKFFNLNSLDYEYFLYDNKKKVSINLDKILNLSLDDYYSKIRIIPKLYLSNVENFQNRYIVKVNFLDYDIGTVVYILDYKVKKMYWVSFYPYSLLNEREAQIVKERYKHIDTITHFLILDDVINNILNTYGEKINNWNSKHFWEYVSDDRKEHLKTIIYDFEKSYLTNNNIIGKNFYEIANVLTGNNLDFMNKDITVGIKRDENGNYKLLFKEVPITLEYKFIKTYLTSKDINIDKLNTKLDFFVLDCLGINF